MHPRSRSKAPSWWPASHWALGNLQHVEGSTDEGFQTDWRIAPEQWEYINCENAGASGKAVTFKPTDYTQYDHFNWGGIANPFLCAAEHPAVAAVGTDISGRMYTLAGLHCRHYGFLRRQIRRPRLLGLERQIPAADAG